MKKWIIFFLIFAAIITWVLYKLQTSEFITQNDWTKLIANIEKNEKVDLNKFIQLYNDKQFEKIDITDNSKIEWYKLKWETENAWNSMILKESIKQKNYEVYSTLKPYDTSLNELGLSLTGSTPINIKTTEKSVLWKVFLEQILPLLFFVFLLIVLFKVFWPKWWGGGFPFWVQAGKLRTKMDVKTTFKDVAWMDESKEELKEIVDYLKNSEKYKKVGARVPKWVLLWWPPWSGKTLLARAVAWEAWVPFFSASGSEFMEMLVWMWAAKVRELFNKAKTTTPSIIFIDEIDSIGKKRWAWHTGWHQEQEQTLNQILTEMDWFDKDTNIIVIAATNRPDILDPALMRPWRFDRKVYIGKPTLEERVEILKLHTKDKKLDKDIDLQTIAKRTSWFVGADLENIANEAAIKVAKDERKVLTNDDFEYALEKIVMWPEKKIKTLKEKERKIVTYHELWHAVTAYFLPNSDPVEKISIVSRWMALWVTWMMPEEDKYLYSKAKFLDELVTLLWGRAAEEIFFGKEEITTWASNDLEKATRITSDMIMKYWMDEDLGTVLYYDKDKAEWTPFKPFSEQTSQIIDDKMKSILKVAYEKAKQIIKENIDTIEKLASILLEKEYLSKEEFESIMKDPTIVEKMLEENKAKNEAKETIKKETATLEEKEEQVNTAEDKDEKDNSKKVLWNMLDKFLKKNK